MTPASPAANQAVVVATAHTPIGTAYKGSLVEMDGMVLGALAVREVLRRSGIPAEHFDDVQLGETLQGGGDIARHAAIEAGLQDVAGVAHNQHCASGLTSLSLAAGSIMSGKDDVVVAGGVQSTSNIPMTMQRDPVSGELEEGWLSPTHPGTPDAPARDMTVTVGWNTAQLVGISREEMDAWALRSHQRAVDGIDSGAFEEEIFAVEATRGGESFTFAEDEHPRRDTDMDRLASLKPLHPELEGFSITAGNSSGIKDAAAAVVMTSRRFAETQDLEPLAVVRSWVSVGVPPAETGLAPIKAIPQALERAGLGTADVDLWEINEAFASVPIAAVRALGLDEEVVNPLGSGCSLGHPVAASGTRMAITLSHELRRRGGGVAVAAMCAGGGMGAALVLEVPEPQ
jgi:acetyl-CoA C-acetyltransferase